MSRSYRHAPVFKDAGDKFYKRQASKKVRHAELDDGSMYKKLFCSWNISDWRFWGINPETDNYHHWRK